MLLVLALAWRPNPSTPERTGPAISDASGSLALAAGGSAPAAAANASTTYDADGVPRMLNGEPVLRRSAIVERAGSGGASPFLVAGWHIQEAIPTCAPSAFHCGSTSLADSPRAAGSGRITLDHPAGTQFSFDEMGQWVGGFYVLRVRAACSLPPMVCLVVDEEIGPPGDLPDQPGGFDADGLPQTVDGQQVVRGTEVAKRLATTWDTGPLYIAGRVEAAPSDGAPNCPDLVTWDAHPCPAVRLADPDRGQPFDATAPKLEVARWALQQAWDPAALWPGGYVVLRAESRFILGFVSPPGAQPEATQAPMPSIEVLSGAYNTRVVEVQGRHVHWGAGVARLLAGGTAASFMVTGVVRERPCPTCAGGTIPVLLEPQVKGAKDGGTAFPLLRGDGSAFVLGRGMLWTEPRGVVVLEVRPYARPCPPDLACKQALEVLSVAATMP